MSDISITATNVIPAADAVIEHGKGNAAIAAGQLCYYDSATQLYGLHDANGAGDIHTLRGMCVAACNANGGRISVQTKGDVAVGAVLTQGKDYIGSGTTPGGVAPVADQASGWYSNSIGKAKTTSVLTINVVNGPAAQ